MKLKNPKIESHEILEPNDLIALERRLRALSRAGQLSIVIIRS